MLIRSLIFGALLLPQSCSFWTHREGEQVHVFVGPQPPAVSVTPLVARVQNAGSGQLSGLPPRAIEEWLTRRPDLTQSVYAECLSIAESARAAWWTSTEGGLCKAAGAAHRSIERDRFFRHLRPMEDPTKVPSTFGDLGK